MVSIGVAALLVICCSALTAAAATHTVQKELVELAQTKAIVFFQQQALHRVYKKLRLVQYALRQETTSDAEVSKSRLNILVAVVHDELTALEKVVVEEELK